MKEKTQKNGHLVLVPIPFQGHINPMLQLAKALHSNGFDITIAHTIHNSPMGPESHPEFSFLPLPDGLSDRSYSVAESVAQVLTMNESCKEGLRRFMEERDSAVRCVISDELMFGAEQVAECLRIPSVILRTTSAATALARPALVRLVKEGALQDYVPDDLVPGLGPLRFKDLPFSPSSDFQKASLLVAKAYGNRTSRAIVWNTTHCLEESILEEIQQQCQSRIFPVAPLHMLASPVSSSLINEDRGCFSWLEKQPRNSVIYVSISGSLASLGEEEVREIAWGLANSGQRFLWVIRPGSIRGSDWIELLPEGFQSVVAERGCVVKWAPQKEVLAHSSVGGFWSHCGWNSTLESLAEGVPMICKPCFSDQYVNARYVSHVWRVGLGLEELERGQIEKAIRRMILDDEGNEMRARAMELKGKFEASTRKDGSSYNALNELVNLLMSY